MISISDIAKQTGLSILAISREIESIGFKSERIGRRFFVTEEQKESILLSLYFKLKIECLTFESKINYD
jgi:hypothetical protein